jgi:hypothetical protein
VVRLVLLLQQITIGPNAQVSAARPTWPHNEVVMAADPRTTGRLIACSMYWKPDGNMGSAAYVSFDDGRSWSEPIVSGALYANDPTCAYGADGSVFFAHKTRSASREVASSDFDRLGLHHSRDGGRTWAAELRGPQTTDRPWIAVDPRLAAPHGRIYLAYNAHVHAADPNTHDNASFRNAIALQASDDGGRTFHTYAARALMTQSADTGSNAAMSDVQVLSHGTVVVLYTQQKVGGRNAATAKLTELAASLHVLRSTDGGDSLEPAVEVAKLQSGYNAVHTRGVPARMTVDAQSARLRDRLYVVWTDITSGRGRIMSAHSSDAGKTWSKPIAVDDDVAPRGANAGPDAFMPAVAVNGAGVVGVTWYDRRDNADNQGYTVRFAASLDGGASWLASVRVSTAPNARSQQNDSFFLVSGGDTAGLAAGADGRFHALWIDNRTGTQQVWTAPITVIGN